LKKVKSGENTDLRHLNPKKRTRIRALIAFVRHGRDWQINIKIALANRVSVKTVHSILHKDLGIVKKSARCA
jgi:hypothetical protein